MSFSSEPRGAPGHGLRDFSRPGSTFAGGPGGIKQTDRQADGGQGVHSQAVSAGAAGGYPHGADRLVGRALPSPFMAFLPPCGKGGRETGERGPCAVYGENVRVGQPGPPDVHGRRDSVSYTHLRAHETRHDLVCRLLLEKKKNKN